jgi:transcriptional antiterminator RfaH
MLDTISVIPTGDLALTLDSRWYAVQTRPKQEERATLNLRGSGLTTFLPMIRQPRKAHSAASAPAPLFPRYLFVRCDIAQHASRIRYTRGVTRVLGTSAGPTPLDDEVIESIQRRLDDGGYVRLIEPEPLHAGDPVEITDGPLSGFVGIFHSATTATERVVLLLNAMNNQMRVVVDSMVVKRLTA